MAISTRTANATAWLGTEICWSGWCGGPYLVDLVGGTWKDMETGWKACFLLDPLSTDNLYHIYMDFRNLRCYLIYLSYLLVRTHTCSSALSGDSLPRCAHGKFVLTDARDVHGWCTIPGCSVMDVGDWGGGWPMILLMVSRWGRIGGVFQGSFFWTFFWTWQFWMARVSKSFLTWHWFEKPLKVHPSRPWWTHRFSGASGFRDWQTSSLSESQTTSLCIIFFLSTWSMIIDQLALLVLCSLNGSTNIFLIISTCTSWRFLVLFVFFLASSQSLPHTASRCPIPRICPSSCGARAPVSACRPSRRFGICRGWAPGGTCWDGPWRACHGINWGRDGLGVALGVFWKNNMYSI